MLIYAAHLPHSPLLLSQIGKSKTILFKKTRRAIAEVAGDLYVRNIETLILITPHGPGLSASHIINLAPRLAADLSPLGDFTVQPNFPSDAALSHRIQEKLQFDYPIKIITKDKMDTAVSAVMLQLMRDKKDYKIIPLTYGLFPLADLYSFGRDLREVLENSPKRVALISLGNLAHNREGWDKNLIKNFNANHTPLILESNLAEVDALSVAGFRPLVMVLGALAEINYKVDILSYQQRFGVGMVVVRFIF